MHTAADFDIELVNTILSEKEIAVLFDDQLNFVAASAPALLHLQQREDELIGRCVLDVFPDVIASANHRNLLRALEGESIMNVRLVARNGIPFIATYIPVYPDGYVKGIVVYGRKIEESAA